LATNERDDQWPQRELEVPELDEGGQIDWSLFWLYRSKNGVRQPRPIFTGDVFVNVPTISDGGTSIVAVVQHPCSLFNRNNELRDVLLTARLVDYQELTPSQWVGHYDVMPVVIQQREHKAIVFPELELVRSTDLELKKRVACMEIQAIALLLQRWTNFNTRVVVPRWRFEQVIEAQFLEADGMESWCSERRRAGVTLQDAMKEATGFLDEKSDDTGKPRRELLKQPEYRKYIVRRMKTLSKQMSDDEISERQRRKTEAVEREIATATSPGAASEALNSANCNTVAHPDESAQS
jgi:hypothetical protein